MIFLYQLYLGQSFRASLSHALIAVMMMSLIYRFPEYEYPLATTSLINSLIYFSADLLSRFNWTKLIHHFISITAIIMTFSRPPEVYRYIAIGSGILEASGPFWTFLRIRLEHSSEISLPAWYDRRTAGTIFMIVFFLDRFVWFNYHVFWCTPEVISTELTLLFFVPFTALNMYWFNLLVRGFLKEMAKST